LRVAAEPSLARFGFGIVLSPCHDRVGNPVVVDPFPRHQLSNENIAAEPPEL
jgi:hypothetical protein